MSKPVMLATAHYGDSINSLLATAANTIRVVCVIMGLSSLAFYAMAFRVPVVSSTLQSILLASC